MAEPIAQRGVRPSVEQSAAFAAFFLSGASSLVFQTLWSRMLSHVFGSSSVAVSSVVSVFMGGLGLGAYLFGKRAERLREPLLFYALAESAVGCSALAIPYLLQPDGWLAHVNAALRAQLGGDSRLFLLARFGCIVPMLIVPTTLMGSTLPLLTRHFVAAQSDAEQASRTVGRLYAINTSGAVLGVFACSFVLLPRFGVLVANAFAASTNFALAGIILVLRRYARAPAPAATSAEDAAATASAATASAALPRPLRWAAALAFAGSGLSALLYEVVWSRALVNTIGGSLYSFALILTTFLVGIAAGSALLSALYTQRVRALGLAATGSTLAALLVFGPWAAQLGLLPAGAIVGATIALICAAARLSRRSSERMSLLSEEPSASYELQLALRLLLIPCGAAAAALLQRADRLAWISCAVVLALCGFLALLLLCRSRPFASLVALQVFIAASTLMSAAFADELSLTFASMVAPLYDQLPDRVGSVQAFMFATAALCVLPSALGMGAVFPATLRVWTSGGRAVARDVGIVYAGNTVGSILGAWLPGFVLMPALGMQQTLYVGVAWNLVSALALACVALAFSRPETPCRRAATLTSAAIPWLCALVVFAALRPERLLGWNISKMTLGAFRISLARDVLDEETWGAPDLLYYRDGLSTTVTVERWGRHLSLKNNGKVDASNGDDMPTQIMVAALPLLLHQPGQGQYDAAIIGFGSGVTVGAALRFPVRSVEVIELERATVEASRYFADVNHLSYVLDSFPYVREPRLSVIADDGRNYLAATSHRFDVIISEPSNPWLTGVSDLFTSDHFRIAKRRLKPGGIYCQWAQLYELSADNVKTLYRTFGEQFEYILAFSAEDQSSDTILLGSDSPLPLDLARIERGLRDPRVASELARAHIHSAEDVVARVLLSSRAELLQFTGSAPINTDDNARIELAAPRDLIGFERHKGYLETMYADSWPYGRVADRLQGLGNGAPASERCARLALSLLAHGRRAQVPWLLERARVYGESPQLDLAREIYALLSGRAPEPALDLGADPTPAQGEPRALGLLRQGYRAIREQLAQQHYATALRQLDTLPSRLRRDAGPAWALFESYVRYKAGHYDGAIERLEDMLREHPDFADSHSQLYYYLARAQQSEQRFAQAVSNMRAYVSGARARAAAARASGQMPTSVSVEQPAAP